MLCFLSTLYSILERSLTTPHFSSNQINGYDSSIFCPYLKYSHVILIIFTCLSQHLFQFLSWPRRAEVTKSKLLK